VSKFWQFNRFAREYFEEFSSPRFQQGSVQQRHRLLLQFTVTVLHEMARIVLMKKSEAYLIPRVAIGFVDEPESLYQPTDVMAEIGHAFETWAFGGSMLTTGMPVALGGFGLSWYPWLWASHQNNIRCMDWPRA
jgi:hypothetical protein